MDNYYLFLGRLSKEKGIINLVNAWIEYVRNHSEESLYICGDGPERESVEDIVRQNNPKVVNINVLGGQPREKALGYISDAKATILPSICFESGPMTVIESFSMGVPIICSDLGNIGCIIIEGENGAKFDPLSTDSIVDAINRFNTYDYEKLKRNSLITFEEKFSKEKNMELFRKIYESGKVY